MSAYNEALLKAAEQLAERGGQLATSLTALGNFRSKSALPAAQAIMRGGKRAAIGASAVAGLGVVGRSAGSRGLSPKSSAPPPGGFPGY